MFKTNKFYDAVYDSFGPSVYVTNQDDSSESVFIECECGTHLLRVQCDSTVYHNSDGTKRIRQEIYLAMFSYGNRKDTIWRRIAIAFKYLRTGKMFSDQLCLTPDEAKKLESFIAQNINQCQTNNTTS